MFLNENKSVFVITKLKHTSYVSFSISMVIYKHIEQY